MSNNAQIGTLSGIYDPAQISVMIQSGAQSNLLSGFGENVVTVERSSNQAESYAGADGGVVKWFTNDRRGKITIDLLPTSPSNATLASLARTDESVGGANFSLMIKDLLGNDVVNAAPAWIMKEPRVLWKKGVEVRSWEIETANLDMKVAGQGVIS